MQLGVNARVSYSIYHTNILSQGRVKPCDVSENVLELVTVYVTYRFYLCNLCSTNSHEGHSIGVGWVKSDRNMID